VVRPTVTLRPTTTGGGQERGMRSGTENPALIAGFAQALSEADRLRPAEAVRVNTLRKLFVDDVSKRLPRVVINGSKDECLPNIVSVSLPGVLSEMLVLALEKEGVLVSAGSACSFSGDNSGSDVIRALGKEDLSESTIRFSFGRQTSTNDVSRAVDVLCRVVSRHGKISSWPTSMI